jgi:hypothetical protein
MATKVPPLALDSTQDFSALVPAAFQAANAALIQANVSLARANAAFATANSASIAAAAGGGGTDQVSRNNANDAFIQANTATSDASTAGSYANSAFLHANAAFTAANTGGIDTWVRDAANAASSYANSAYTQANTATTNAVTADDKAVTAGSYANSAFLHANAAFEAANSGGGGGASGDISVTSITNSGNLTFTGTGKRITGDFTSVSSGVYFQTSTTDSITILGIMPNGTSPLSTFQSYSSTDPENSSVLSFGIGTSGTEAVISSFTRGTGTALPMRFNVGGGGRVWINTDGNVGVGKNLPNTILDVFGTVTANGYTSAVSAITGATPALSSSLGDIQTWTLPSNSTPTNSLTTGQSITLMITAGAFTITWPSVTWKTGGGTAPTLNTSGVTAIQLWRVGSTLYGARVGNN